MASKKLFYELCELREFSRGQGYRMLAEELDIPQRECHFGWFEVERCEKAKRFLEVQLKEHRPTIFDHGLRKTQDGDEGQEGAVVPSGHRQESLAETTPGGG